MDKIQDHKFYLSMIVPFYNCIDLLQQCLDSLRIQTFYNIEIIVVDNASNEIYTHIKEKYENDHRIKWFRLEKNTGPGGARNYGMRQAQGKYIGFCDCDDWVDNDYCKKAIEYIEKEGADIAICGQMRHYDYYVDNIIYKSKYNDLIVLDGDIAFRILTEQYNFGIKIIPSCVNKIYLKQFLLNHDILFEEMSMWEDLHFSVLTFLKSRKIICIPNTLYHHRKRIGSEVQSFKEKYIDDFYNIFYKIQSFLIKQDIYEVYKFNYFKYIERYNNLIIRQIFEFVDDENMRKHYMIKAIGNMKKLINIDEYIQYISAEDLRRHIQPNIKTTRID